MSKTAIIFTHNGYKLYLSCALKNAKKTNSDKRIVLLGDKENLFLSEAIGIEHYSICDYFAEAQRFKDIYIYQSSNPYNYELFCFQRWFVLKDFIEKNNIQDFWACDSDVLIYDNLNKYLQDGKYKFSVVNVNGPQCSHFTRESINEFCSYIIKQYTDLYCLKRLSYAYDVFVKNNLPGGNCDMTIFEFYQKDNSDVVYDYGLKNLNNGYIFYDASQVDKNQELFNHIKKHRKTIAQLKFNKNIPYLRLKDSGDKIIVPVIHFQGIYKDLMYMYSLENKRKKLVNELKYILQNTIKPLIPRKVIIILKKLRNKI